MKPSDENDDLWKLLGKASQPSVSPFFARNVIRETRSLRQEEPGFFAMLRRHWQVPVVTAAACCLVAVATSQFSGNVFHSRQIDYLVAIAEQVTESPDFYVIDDLDDLIASEESSLWLDDSAQ